MQGDHDGRELVLTRGRIGPAVVVTADGEIDLGTAQHLRATLDDVLADAGPAPVVLDLTAVSFLGSAGLAVLVEANALAVDRGIAFRVIVADARGRVARALRGAGIAEHLPVFPDVDAALAAT